MPRKFRYYFFILASLCGGYVVSSFLISNLFIGANPKPAWSVFEAKISIVREQLTSQLGSIQFAFPHVNFQAKRIEPTPASPPVTSNQDSIYTPMGFFDAAPAPTAPLAPTEPPTPTQILLPTSTPIPTYSPPPTVAPSYSVQPTQVTKPTKTPKPTTPPEPTNAPPIIDFPKVDGDPLKQPWYGSKSLACYTTERMIEVYANGITPNACFKNVQASLESQMVSTTLLGRSIQIHKKALPAYQAVSKTLDQYKVDSSTYKFPSKTYKIKNVGGYIFRCNVNASTSGKFDTCAEGCKLSPHSFGIAVDINYEENCNGCKNYDMPKEIYETFELYGFRWGGHYPLLGSTIDAMHFEYMRDLCDGV